MCPAQYEKNLKITALPLLPTTLKEWQKTGLYVYATRAYLQHRYNQPFSMPGSTNIPPLLKIYVLYPPSHPLCLASLSIHQQRQQHISLTPFEFPLIYPTLQKPQNQSSREGKSYNKFPPFHTSHIQPRSSARPPEI